MVRARVGWESATLVGATAAVVWWGKVVREEMQVVVVRERVVAAVRQRVVVLRERAVAMREKATAL